MSFSFLPCPCVSVCGQSAEDYADINEVLSKMKPPRGDVYDNERG